MIKLVVLDMDDTLYLESNYVKSGIGAAAQALATDEDAKAFTKAATSHFEKGSRGNLFNLALKDLAIPESESLIREMITLYREHKPSISLCPDSEEMLEELQDKAKTALISDGYLPPQKRKAEALGLYSRLDRVILTEELGRNYWKPHPKSFELLESEFGFKGSECVYVGDNPNKDFDAPIERDWKTVRIMREGGLHRTLPNKKTATAQHSIVSLENLSQLLAL